MATVDLEPSGTEPDSVATAPPELPLRIQALLEETLIPSPSGTELQRDPMHDYLHRFTQRSPHVAELFLENTKITPASLTNGAMDEQLLAAARRWYFNTAYHPHEEAFDFPAAERAGVCLDVNHVDRPVGRLLAALAADEQAAQLLYGLDLYVVLETQVFRVMPAASMMWLVRRVPSAERHALAASIALRAQPPAGPHADLLVVIAVPWRYMVFQGPRGCRRMLMESGRLTQWFETRAREHDVALDVTLDFADGALEEVLLLDGVERTALAVLTVGQEA
jgi:hypothetical protein